MGTLPVCRRNPLLHGNGGYNDKLKARKQTPNFAPFVELRSEEAWRAGPRHLVV